MERSVDNALVISCCSGWLTFHSHHFWVWYNVVQSQQNFYHKIQSQIYNFRGVPSFEPRTTGQEELKLPLCYATPLSRGVAWNKFQRCITICLTWSGPLRRWLLTVRKIPSGRKLSRKLTRKLPRKRSRKLSASGVLPLLEVHLAEPGASLSLLLLDALEQFRELGQARVVLLLCNIWIYLKKRSNLLWNER